jgi:hypothetical protein
MCARALEPDALSNRVEAISDVISRFRKLSVADTPRFRVRSPFRSSCCKPSQGDAVVQTVEQSGRIHAPGRSPDFLIGDLGNDDCDPASDQAIQQ